MPLFIIVFGTRWHFRPKEGGFKGHLTCTTCHGPEFFVEKEAFKAFTIYWWAAFRTEDGGSLVECSRCAGRFCMPAELQTGSAPMGVPVPEGV
jgi:hypothetical protein